MTNALVSIVIPVYKGEKHIKNMLNTLWNLHYTRWEAVFVDDGSKDGSADLIKEAQNNDERIRYVYKENGGIASARNCGIDNANGDYICFWDQDDTVEPEILNVMVGEIGDADFIKGEKIIKSVRSVNRLNLHSEATFKMGGCTHICRDDEIWKYIVWDAAMRNLAPVYGEGMVSVAAAVWTNLFRVSFIKKNGIRFKRFLDYEDDLLFMIDVMKYAESFVYDKRPLYVWNENPGSESRNRIINDRYIEDFYNKFCDFREFMLDSINTEGLPEDNLKRFSIELQKSCLLWNLSNETGRGIKDRRVKNSIQIVKKVVKKEKEAGIIKGINKEPLGISVFGARGIKRTYYSFRDKFLTFCMIKNMCAVAVLMNKYLLHGRYHW